MYAAGRIDSQYNDNNNFHKNIITKFAKSKFVPIFVIGLI